MSKQFEEALAKLGITDRTSDQNSSSQKPGRSRQFDEARKKLGLFTIEDDPESYINSYFQDYNSFYDKWKSGVDSAGWSEAMTASDRIGEEYYGLKSRMGNISSFLSKNRDAINTDYYDEVMANLDAVGSGYQELQDAYNSLAEYYGQWGSQEEYDSWMRDYEAQQEQARQYELYQQNKKRLQELQEERDRIKVLQNRGSIPTSGGLSGVPYAADFLGSMEAAGLIRQGETGTNAKSIREIDDEIAQLQAAVDEYEAVVWGAEGHVADAQSYSTVIPASDGLSDEERQKQISDIDFRIQALEFQLQGLYNDPGAASLGDYISGKENELDQLKSQRDALVLGGEHTMKDEAEIRLGVAQRNREVFSAYDWGAEAYSLDEAMQMQEAYKQLSEANAEIRNANDTLKWLDYVDEYTGKKYDDNFFGQFAANYTLGRMSQDSSLFWNAYLDDPSEENRRMAETADELIERFSVVNAETLADDGTLPWISRDLANYVPQLLDQMKYSVAGTAAGAAFTLGNPWGAKAGRAAGSAVYGFQTMRGAAFRELIKAGMDEQTARSAAMDEGLISGTIEGLGEIASIFLKGGGKLIDIITDGGLTSIKKVVTTAAGKNIVTRLLTGFGKYLLSAGSEYIEESTQEAVSIANQERTESGILELLGKMLETYALMFTDPETEEDQAKKEQMREAGMGGLRLGLMLGGGEMIGNATIGRAVGNFRAEMAVGDLRPKLQELTAKTLELNPDDKNALRVQTKMEQGKNVSGMEIYKMLVANEDAAAKKDSDIVREAAAARLTELGETGDIEAIADVIARQAAGEQLRRKDIAVIQDSKYGQQIVSELDLWGVKGGEYSFDNKTEGAQWRDNVNTLRQQNRDYAMDLSGNIVSPDVQRITNRLIRDGADVQEASETAKKLAEAGKIYGKQADVFTRTYLQGQSVEQYRLAFANIYQAGKDGVSRELIKDYGAGLTDAQKEMAYLAGQKDGSGTNAAKVIQDADTLDVNAEGKTVRTDTNEDIELDGFDTVGENGTLRTKGGQTVSIRNVAFSSADDAILYNTIAKVSSSANIANTLLKQFRGQDSLSAIDFAAGLMEAYDAGQIGDKTVQQLRDAEFAGNLTTGQREAAYNKGKRMGDLNAVKRKRDVRRKSGGKKDGKLHFDRKGRKFDSMRESSLAVMDTLAKALGVDIYVYESYVNEAGNRVYLSDRGEKKAPNGFYDPTDGSIHIDLNAGNTGRGTMLFTVAHELTHFIKDWSSVKYRAMADALVKQYQKQGVSVSELVDNQIAKAKQNGREISRQEAFDEVVADSMESMLADENAAAFLERLAKRDNGLKEKIVSWLKDLAAKLKNALTAYKDVKPDSQEGKMVAEMEDFRKEIMGIYTSALVDAGENFMANGGNLTANGDYLYSERVTDKDSSSEVDERYNIGTGKSLGREKRFYDWDFLVSLKPMKIAFLPEVSDVKDANNDINQSTVVSLGMKNARSVGTVIDGKVYVTNRYTGRQLRIDHESIRHGLNGDYRRLLTNSRMGAVIGDIVQNAVPINGRKDTADNVLGTYSMAFYATDSRGREFVGIVTVEEYTGKVESLEYYDVAHAVSGRQKKGSQADTKSQGVDPIKAATISIEDFLGIVKSTHQSILSKSVLDHYGETRNPKGHYADSVLFSDRDPTAEATRAALEKENGKLREDVSRLRELLSLQGKVTGGTVPKQSSVEAAAKWLNKYAGAKADVKELSRMLTDFYKFLATDKDYSWEDVQQRAMVIARHLQDNVQIKPQISDYARDVLREVRGRKITLDEIQRAEVERMYGSYGAFRKAAIGNVTFVKEGGISLDTMWNEWATLFPGTFDSEISASDQPMALMDAIDALRNSDTTVMEYAYNRDSIAQDLAVAVYDSYWRVDALVTVADRDQRKINDLTAKREELKGTIRDKNAQINKLRAEHRAEIDSLKNERNKTVAELKQKRQDDMKKLRTDYKKKLEETRTRYQEAREKAVDSRNRAQMRKRIQKTVNELNHLLLDGDKKRHVPESMRKAVSEILSAVNMETSTEEARSAAFERTVARYNQRIKLENDPAERARLEAARDAYIGKGDQFKAKIDALANAYEDIKNSSDPALQDAYSDAVSQYLFTLEANVGDTRLGDMTLDQLKTVQEVLNIVISTIRNANKSFLNERAGTIEQQASRSISEVSSAWVKKKESESDVGGWLRGFHYRNLKPIYLMRAIGSQALTDAYNNVRRGEDTWYRDIEGGRGFYLENARKYGYGKWDFKKTTTFSDDSGGQVKLTLGQILSLYAYSRREAAAEHLRIGGVVLEGESVRVNKLGMKVTYHLNDATSHQLGPETLGTIIGTLTKEQRAFVDAMQNYLSTTMADKGNEVSLAMYGIKLFREKNYFPIKSAKQFVDQKNEPVGEVKLKNSGFTNKTVPMANNPMVLRDFMDVWADHVNEMSTYHAFVLAIEDFNRILNYQTERKEKTAPVSLKQTIQSYMGREAVSAVRELIQSVNGGARVDPAASFVSKAINKFKKNAVFSSMSVVIQQPSAIVRAAALIDPKYFEKMYITKNIVGDIFGRKKVDTTWEIIKKYAPVAGIKDMGYFDTNMGKSTVDYIKGPEHDGIKDVLTGIVKREDGSFDELLSMAPGYADKVTWCAIWEAVKRETAGKYPKLSTRSEEFLQKCGDRFTEVITQTQVYDSVFSRSGNMRSKDKLMGMVTSFMAEPTTSINMIYDAVLQGTRGNKAYMRRAIGAVFGAAVLNAILKSLVYAARDDDDDESVAEKYISALVSALKDDVLFLVPNSIPFVRDIMSLIQGYSVERTDMTLADDIISAIRKLNSDKVDTEDKILGIVGSVGNLVFPAKNMIRGVKALWNSTYGWWTAESSTAMGIRNAAREGWGGQTVSNARQLYEARMAGDASHEARVAARYDTEKSADSAVVSAIRDAFMDGDLTEEEAKKHLILYGNTDAGDAYWKVKEWIYAKDKGSSDGYGKYNDLYDAILSGGDIQEAVAEFTENGYDEEEVMSNVKKEVGRWFWDNESETRISAEQASDILEKYFGMKQGEIQETILKWSMKRDTRISFDGLREAYLDEVVSEADTLTYLQKYGGLTEYDAKERVTDWKFEDEHGYAYADIKSTYLDEEITRAEAIAVMTEIGGKSREDAEQRVRYWDYEEKTGVDYENKSQQYKRGIITRQQLRQALIDLGEYSGTDADIQIEVYDWEQSGLQGSSFARVKNWHEYCEGAGVSKSVWMSVSTYAATVQGEKRSDGSTIPGSKAKKIMEKINSMNISRAQKDALALAIGEQQNWSEKTIAKYKLW